LKIDMRIKKRQDRRDEPTVMGNPPTPSFPVERETDPGEGVRESMMSPSERGRFNTITHKPNPHWIKQIASRV